MGKVKKERTKENIEKELDELEERGFDIVRINLILNIEKKLDRFIYPSISNKITAENLRDIKNVIENSDDFEIGNITLLFKAVQHEVDIKKLNLLKNPESLNAEIEAFMNGYELQNYLTSEMPPNVVRLITTFLVNNIDPENFKYEEFSRDGLYCLDYLAQKKFKHKKESFKAFFNSKMSPQQFEVLISNKYFDNNTFDGVLCNEEFSVEQLKILSRAKIHDNINIDDIAFPEINEKVMDFFITAKKEEIDMSKFYLSGLDIDVLKSIYYCKKFSIDYTPILDNKISPDRAKIINETIKKHKGAYNLSILFDMTIDNKVAESIYFLQTKGYSVSKEKELEI